MTAPPDMRIEIAFDTTPDDALRWVLDVSALPITLGLYTPANWVDVTAYNKGLVIERGKKSDLAAFAPGRLTLQLDNIDSRFHPLNLSGPYVDAGVTQVKPGRQVRVFATHPGTAVEYQLFRGTIREWAFEVDEDYNSRAVVSATDALEDTTSVPVSVSTSAALSGVAVQEILDAASIGASEVAAGSSTLQAMTFTGTCSQALRTIEQTEQGFIYADADNGIVFIDRGSIYSVARHNTSQATFGAGNLEYEQPKLDYGSENIKNSVVVTRQGGSAQTETDEDSIFDYGKRHLSLSGMANPDDSDADALAQYILENHKDPAFRVRAITIAPQRHDDLMTQALARELLDRITVNHTPPGGASYSQTGFIIGIRHAWTPPGAWKSTFTTMPTAAYDAGRWILDVSAFSTETVLTY